MFIELKDWLESKRNSKSKFFVFIVEIKDLLWMGITLLSLFFNYFLYLFLKPFRKFFCIFNKYRINCNFLNKNYRKFKFCYPKVFCINLKEREDKKNSMKKEFFDIGFNAEFFHAIDGKKLHKKKLVLDGLYDGDVLNKKRRNMTLPEIGCYLSHVELWKRIVEEKIPIALICEDDIFFKKGKNEIHNLIRNLPEDFDLCHLDRRLNKIKILNEEISHFRNKSIAYGTSCYLIGLNGAKKLLGNCFPMKIALDLFISDMFESGELNLFISTKNIIGSLSKRPNWPESRLTCFLNKYLYKKKDIDSDIPLQFID